MLFVLFVSLLFSLGACIHGLACVTIAFGVVIGGIVGRIVAGTWLGFVLGSMFGVQFSLIAVVVCAYLALSGSANVEGVALWTVLGIAALIGGVLGGFLLLSFRGACVDPMESATPEGELLSSFAMGPRLFAWCFRAPRKKDRQDYLETARH